jgi:hypothetical protein
MKVTLFTFRRVMFWEQKGKDEHGNTSWGKPVIGRTKQHEVEFDCCVDSVTGASQMIMRGSFKYNELILNSEVGYGNPIGQLHKPRTVCFKEWSALPQGQTRGRRRLIRLQFDTDEDMIKFLMYFDTFSSKEKGTIAEVLRPPPPLLEKVQPRQDSYATAADEDADDEDADARSVDLLEEEGEDTFSDLGAGHKAKGSVYDEVGNLEDTLGSVNDHHATKDDEEEYDEGEQHYHGYFDESQQY